MRGFRWIRRATDNDSRVSKSTQRTDTPNVRSQPNDELLQRSFYTVLGAYRSHDETAGRVLTAIAFLTTAAGAVLSQTHTVAININRLRGEIATALGHTSPEVDQVFDGYVNRMPLFHGHNAPLYAFWAYLLLALTSAAFYLAVIWPAIKTNLEVDRSNPHPPGLRYRLFYREIASEDADFNRWRDQWSSQYVELEGELRDDTIRETFLLAQRTRDKENYARWGSWILRAALIPFAILASSLFLPDQGRFVWTSAIGVGILCVVYFVEASRLSENHERIGLRILSIVVGGGILSLALWHSNAG